MTTAAASPELLATPSDLQRFFLYLRDFELAWLTGDWSLLLRHFDEEVRHAIDGGGGPLGQGGLGRDAVVAGLKGGVDAVDRRFDVRIPEIVDGPIVRDDGIWMRFALTLRREGLPDLRLSGEHLATYADGRIATLREGLEPGEAARVADYLVRYEALLREPGCSRPSSVSAADAECLDAAMGRSLVRCYGAAKSKQDTDAALTVCSEEFSIDTVAFGISSHDREDTRFQLEGFFESFPDYRVNLEGFATSRGVVTCWGRVVLTFERDFLGQRATGRSAELPIFCVFTTSGGVLASERFFFDLAALCSQVGLDLAVFSDVLRSLRPDEIAA